MKYFAAVSSLVALIALVPARVAADDVENADDWDHHHSRPPPSTQVLWGQCGGYYYSGTTLCPKGAYCRYFSDWYSQCNLIGQ